MLERDGATEGAANLSQFSVQARELSQNMVCDV